MKKRFFISLFCSLGLSIASHASLVGEWRLMAMMSKGQDLPLPNPDLYLSWTFFKNGTERLYWDRGGTEFCERFARFSIDSGFLIEKTFALNPKNAVDCAKDPDMQLGKETRTKIEASQEEVKLYFQLGDDELIYILKPVAALRADLPREELLF